MLLISTFHPQIQKQPVVQNLSITHRFLAHSVEIMTDVVFVLEGPNFQQVWLWRNGKWKDPEVCKQGIK